MKSLLLTALLLASATVVNAQEKPIVTDMVVATVNTKAITYQELKNRITLTKLLVNRQLSALEFDILKKQAMEQLVNEELKRQYAEKKGLKVSSKELNKAVAFIEKQRRMQPGQLLAKLPEHLKASALEQIKDSVLQQKIVKQVIIPRVFVPEYEINNLLDNVISQAHSKEYKISKIFINSSNNPSKDAQRIAKIHEKLISGENFENLVIAFSEGENKLQGGVLGWFSLNELNAKLQKEVKKLAKDEFSKPVKDNSGWFIVKVDDIKLTQNIDTSKTPEYKFVLFKGKDLDKKQLSKLNSMIENVNGYSDFKEFKQLVKQRFDFEVEKHDVWVKEDNIPKKYHEEIFATLPGNFSNVAVEDDKSVKFIYLIDSQIKESAQVVKIRQRITANLQKAKAERKFRQFIKELKTKAFIELR